MKSFTTIFVVSLLAALPYVAAHGFVSQIAIDGKVYKGNDPTNPGKNIASPIRLINTISPVKGATNRAVNCGADAAQAELVAAANPGSKIAFSWLAGGGQNWPHNTGPMLTYLAECTGTTCDKFNAINAKWFKIDEVGKDSNGTWVQQNIMNGGSLTVTLPNNLKAGDYLVRHEIIALHLANSEGGAEFYPSCAQLRIGGNGSGVPNATVSLPGAYSDTDPGIFDPTVFTPGAKYVFPGPPISNLVVSGSSSSNTASNSTATSASSAPAVSATIAGAVASKNSGNCMIVDKDGKKRQYSRVMRRLLPMHH